jgi:hypothetical protein
MKNENDLFWDDNNVEIINFIEEEIIKLEEERNKFKEPYNHAKYMNSDRLLDGAKLFLEYIINKKTI